MPTNQTLREIFAPRGGTCFLHLPLGTSGIMWLKCCVDMALEIYHSSKKSYRGNWHRSLAREAGNPRRICGNPLLLFRASLSRNKADFSRKATRTLSMSNRLVPWKRDQPSRKVCKGLVACPPSTNLSQQQFACVQFKERSEQVLGQCNRQVDVGEVGRQPISVVSKHPRANECGYDSAGLDLTNS